MSVSTRLVSAIASAFPGRAAPALSTAAGIAPTVARGGIMDAPAEPDAAG